jgi:hypothetical protein
MGEVRNQKSGGRVDKCLTSHKLITDREKPGSSSQPPTFYHEPLACSMTPMEKEKVEVATIAVTLPWSPHKVSFQSLISSYPAALQLSGGGAGRPRSEKSCLQ